MFTSPDPINRRTFISLMHTILILCLDFQLGLFKLCLYNWIIQDKNNGLGMYSLDNDIILAHKD